MFGQVGLVVLLYIANKMVEEQGMLKLYYSYNDDIAIWYIITGKHGEEVFKYVYSALYISIKING